MFFYRKGALAITKHMHRIKAIISYKGNYQAIGNKGHLITLTGFKKFAYMSYESREFVWKP
jgi:hypothetical protein